MAAFGEPIKSLPPPQYSGETEKWEEWPWQLKPYVALYKRVAGEVMNSIEGVAQTCTDQVVTEFEESRQLPHQLVEFSRQLHYLLAQLTEEGPA